MVIKLGVSYSIPRNDDWLEILLETAVLNGDENNFLATVLNKDMVEVCFWNINENQWLEAYSAF